MSGTVTQAALAWRTNGLTVGAGGDGDTLRRVGGDHGEEMAGVQRLVDRLGAAALDFTESETCRHDTEDVCALDRFGAAREACALAGILAELAPSRAVLRRPRQDPVTAYVRALRDAAGAVYYCRRLAHASEKCWFSPTGPAADRCGSVLAVAHRLG